MTLDDYRKSIVTQLENFGLVLYTESAQMFLPWSRKQEEKEERQAGSHLSHRWPLGHTACRRSLKGSMSLHRLQYSGNVCLFIFLQTCPIRT